MGEELRAVVELGEERKGKERKREVERETMRERQREV